MQTARVLVRALQRLVPAARGGGSVLCYHLVGGNTGLPVDVRRQAFVDHLEVLAGCVRLVPLADLVTPTPRPEDEEVRSVAITFDDAYANFAEVAWPELESRGIPVTLFVPTEFVNRAILGPLRGAEALPPVSWDWLGDALSSGLLTVGSHSRTHPDLRALSDRVLEDELMGSRRELEDRLGVSVGAFCYPRALRNRRVEARVRSHYSRAVIGGGRYVPNAGNDPLRISRTSVRDDDDFPVRSWSASRIWLEEAISDRVRQLR